MAGELTEVRFEPELIPEGLVVTGISDDQVPQYAPMVQGVLHRAYSRRFVEELGAVPQSAVDEQFDPSDPARVSQQIDRMRRYMDNGTAYYAAHLGRTVSEAVLGIIKVSPSRSRLHWWGEHNCYVNDIAVTQPNRGVGSHLLVVALQGFDQEQVAVTDTQTVNKPTTRWFEARGFEQKGKASEPLEIGTASLEQKRYQGSIKDVLQRTQDRLISGGYRRQRQNP